MATLTVDYPNNWTNLTTAQLKQILQLVEFAETTAEKDQSTSWSFEFEDFNRPNLRFVVHVLQYQLDDDNPEEEVTEVLFQVKYDTVHLASWSTTVPTLRKEIRHRAGKLTKGGSKRSTKTKRRSVRRK